MCAVNVKIEKRGWTNEAHLMELQYKQYNVLARYVGEESS